MKRALLCLCLVSPLCAAPPESFFRALHKVETGGRLGPVLGDQGAALGPLQIHRAYWLESGVAGSYSQCADLAYSRAVVAAYMAKKAPKAWAKGDCRTLAMVHNGGPAALKATGNKKLALENYWNKIKKHL